MKEKLKSPIFVKRPVTKPQLINDLRKMGLKKGDHLAVALSFKSIGYVVGGPDTFIDALLEVVGSEGTIMMNAFTHAFNISNVTPDYIFDFKETMPYTGLVPQTLIIREGSIRSHHPTNSVVCLGRMSKYLTNGHDENSNILLPYERLAKIGGKYLAIGIDDRLVGIRHEAQRRAGLLVVPIYKSAYFRDSSGKRRLFIHKEFPCVKKLPALVPKLENMGAIKRGKIGMAKAIIAYADRLINLMTFMLKENPTLNLCDDLYCYKCRELEKRMNLFERIANPKLFQRNRFIRIVLSWKNILLLKRMNSQDIRKLPKWLVMFSRLFVVFKQLVAKMLT